MEVILNGDVDALIAERSEWIDLSLPVQDLDSEIDANARSVGTLCSKKT